MATREYMAKYTHRISPHPNEYEGPFDMADSAFSNKLTLAKAMRKAGILASGEQLSSFRVEGDRVVTFPKRPSPWHSITLEEGSFPASGVDYSGYRGR